MIRIFGTMTDPSGSPVPGAIIELRAINSTSEVLLGSTVTHKCDQQGTYGFQLALGTYDAYAQNDRCGDMDYLGTARVSDNSVDGDLHSILVDGGINITPPMLDSTLAAAQRAESFAALTAEDRVSTERNAASAKVDADAATTAKDESVSAASTAVSAKDSIVYDASDVRRLAVQVADQAADVSSKHGDVATRAWQVSAQADVVSTKHSEVVTKAAQVSSDASATQSAKNAAVSASSSAQSSAASAAGDAAKAEVAAVKAEQAAQTVVGALIDAGPYNASTGVLPTPVMSGSTKLSSIWKVTDNGAAGGIELGVGDSLVYTARDNSYYKIDNTESVSKVNDKSGVVVLNAADVQALPIGGGTLSGSTFVDRGDAEPQVGVKRENRSTYMADSSAAVGLYSNGLVGFEPSWLLARNITTGIITFGDNRTPSNIDGKDETFTYKGNKVFHKSYLPSAADVGADPSGTATSAITTHEAKSNAHKISGVAGLREELDALASASGGISEIDGRLAVVESKVVILGQRKSTCLVNATGTGAPHETVVAQLPASITINSRYVIPNPFGNSTPVICWAEVFVNGKWSRTGWVFDNGNGFGTSASYVQGEGIVVQTAKTVLMGWSVDAGGGHGATTTVTSAPCRVFVRKLEA